jgi:hypothetical protein
MLFDEQNEDANSDMGVLSRNFQKSAQKSF